MKRIILATGNRGKLKEVREILASLPVEIVSLHEVKDCPAIIEDGETFAENAKKKAETIADFTGNVVIADDSGLEVDCLGGAPGVYSARFAGPEADDEKNNAKLLALLKGVPDKERTARFVCAIALAIPGMETIIVEGSCEGIIGHRPAGEAGFGYDPLFIVKGYGKTFGQLSPEEKNEISHRGKALEKMKSHLIKVLEVKGENESWDSK